MILDAHTHIFQDSVRLDRSSCFDTEPEFRLLYSSPASRISPAEDLVLAMDRHGVDVAVTCGFPWRDPDRIKENNDTVISAVHRFSGRIRGLACFDLFWEGAAQETERCINAGLSGVGELACYLSGIDQQALDRLTPVMAVLREKGNLPCMIHTNEPVGHAYPGKTPVTLEQIWSLAEAFPQNRIILAHWGGGLFFYHALKKKARKILENIWYDTAASPFVYRPGIYDMAAAAGVIEKILFGTDYPLLTPDRYYQDLDQSTLTDDQKAGVLGLNAARLFQ